MGFLAQFDGDVALFWRDLSNCATCLARFNEVIALQPKYPVENYFFIDE